MADEVIAGRYRLDEPLGRGSMSAVWAADDLELGRRVAVKMLGPRADRQRFEREARAAAALSHPNIVSLYDYGQADERPFMVLECLAGGSLEDLLRERAPLDAPETQRIATDVAAGLAHAHERGLVHRDLKPANILFDAEGRAKIADFGIARMGGTGTLTEAGTVLGTASYISPEQASGLPAGPESDVYSFGAILFRMLTGRLPFESSNAMELVRMHRDDPPPAVRDLRPDAPVALAAIAEAALAKDPAARPADGNALLARLDGGDTEATQVLPGATAPAPSPPHHRRRVLPALLAAAVLVLAGVGVGVAVALTRGGEDAGTTTAPALSLPSVPTAASTTVPLTSAGLEQSTTAPTTTAAPTTLTEPSTTAETTTAPTTTAPTTTTAPATTTAPPTTTTAPPTTTMPPTTTLAPATTVVTTFPTTTTP
jgi:eukaryotic-like serine/threonine-protein kinase